MTRLQYLAIAAAVAGLFFMYFGLDTKSAKHRGDLDQVEKSGITIDIKPLVESAKKTLNRADLSEINILEGLIETTDGNAKVAALKDLSGKWYRLNKPYLAGFYAAEVAEELPSGEAWSIAATTYLGGLREDDELLRQGSLQKAVEAFENAISIDPESVQHRVNLALIYAESPPQDNPMKGVQMLLSLNEKHPDDVLVLNALGRLAIKTGQWDKAKERLEKSESLQPDNNATICLLAEVYQQINDPRSQAIKDKCELLTLKK